MNNVRWHFVALWSLLNEGEKSKYRTRNAPCAESGEHVRLRPCWLAWINMTRQFPSSRLDRGILIPGFCQVSSHGRLQRLVDGSGNVKMVSNMPYSMDAGGACGIQRSRRSLRDDGVI